MVVVEIIVVVDGSLGVAVVVVVEIVVVDGSLDVAVVVVVEIVVVDGSLDVVIVTIVFVDEYCLAGKISPDGRSCCCIR